VSLTAPVLPVKRAGVGEQHAGACRDSRAAFAGLQAEPARPHRHRVVLRDPSEPPQVVRPLARSRLRVAHRVVRWEPERRRESGAAARAALLQALLTRLELSERSENGLRKSDMVGGSVG
jgi:hypothetical protein